MIQDLQHTDIHLYRLLHAYFASHYNNLQNVLQDTQSIFPENHVIIITGFLTKNNIQGGKTC